MMILVTILLVTFLLLLLSKFSSVTASMMISNLLFPAKNSFIVMLMGGFLMLACLNILSLICYGFAVTTLLSFNLTLALSLWLASILILMTKAHTFSVLLPGSSPWYLAPFLCLVELVSLSVRPITLCFRLLANMSAGHILLSLICKMQNTIWILGSIFGVLELMVSMVQAFVFFMLVTVYFEESFSH